MLSSEQLDEIRECDAHMWEGDMRLATAVYKHRRSLLEHVACLEMQIAELTMQLDTVLEARTGEGE